MFTYITLISFNQNCYTHSDLPSEMWLYRWMGRQLTGNCQNIIPWFWENGKNSAKSYFLQQLYAASMTALTKQKTYLVVCWNGDINISEWRISVAQCNDWDVDIGSLTHGLMISARISHNKEARLTESSLQQIQCKPWSTWCINPLIKQIPVTTTTTNWKYTYVQ